MKIIKYITCVLMAFNYNIAAAQPYVVGAIGYGESWFTNQRQLHSSVEYHPEFSSPVASAGIGYRAGWAAIEAGMMTLPTYKGTASVKNYPAYKPCTPSPDCPNDAEGRQRIDARAVYVRGNIYLPVVRGIEPFLFAGVLKVDVKNEEHATYNGGTESADFYDSYTLLTICYGLGAQIVMTDKLSARFEWTYIPTFTDEYHTLKRDARLMTAGVELSF